MNKQYQDLALIIAGIVFLTLLYFYGPKDNLYEQLKAWRLKSYSEKQQEGVVVVCKKCKGTGETEQDTSLLMAEALFAMWYNGHITTKKCKVCSKDKLCDVAQKEYDVVMNKYKEIGPKIEKAACPDCMGCGSYKQYKGYRVGREK